MKTFNFPERLKWLKENDPRFKDMDIRPHKIDLSGIPHLEGIMVKFRHPQAQPFVEVARLSEPGAFGRAKMAVYIYGRHDYCPDFSEPHFFVNLANHKKKNIIIRIPALNSPVPDLEILWDFDRTGKSDRKPLKDKLRHWLPEHNADDPLHSNHEMLVIEWNLLNKDNPEVQKMEGYRGPA
jgi:hypothetical protein